MKINDIKGLILPNKKDEEFLKINLDALFSYDFKEQQTYEFDITRSIDNTQKVITINKNIAEPIFLIHKIKEDETFFTNSLKIKVAWLPRKILEIALAVTEAKTKAENV